MVDKVTYKFNSGYFKYDNCHIIWRDPCLILYKAVIERCKRLKANDNKGAGKAE